MDEIQVFKIRKSSYGDRLKLMAARYRDIRQKYAEGDNSGDVEQLMADFDRDFKQLEEEMKRHGLTMDDYRRR